MSYDPSSDKIALYYTGDDSGQPSIVNVPARDLTESDMARLEEIQGSDPEEGLLAGPYRKTKPKDWQSPEEKASVAAKASANEDDTSATESVPAEASGASANPAESEAESAKEDAK